MLGSFLFEVKDHRRAQGTRYELGYILMFAIMGILSGATSYRMIEVFIESKYDVLAELFKLNWKGRPAYTTIRKIIQGTDADELEKSFRKYSKELAENEQEGEQIAIDGKVLRGSFDRFEDQKAIQILSAFVSESQIILAHEEVESKTNEIPVAQRLIEELGLTGKIFTLDAMHCQEETLNVAKDTGNDAVIQVKANQPTLLEDCQRVAETQVPDDTYQEAFNKTRNRIEQRRVEVFWQPSLTHSDKWSAVEALIRVERFRQVFDTRTKEWKDTHEISFYISTSIFSAGTFCRVIRAHWGIENRDHYVRDVSLGEDSSRIRSNPAVFSCLRSFALNILRHNGISNVRLALFRNSMDIHHLLDYQGVL